MSRVHRYSLVFLAIVLFYLSPAARSDEAKPAKVRILLLGDSTVIGSEAAKFLAPLLRERGKVGANR